MNGCFAICFLLAAALMAHAADAAEKQEAADLVLRNGTIITMEDAQPEATALAVAGDRIVWIGDEAKAEAWIGKKTQVIDLKQAFVFPGLIDSHAHVVSLGASRQQLDLLDMRDKQSIIDKVRQKASVTPKGEWIRGRGWDQNLWPVKQFPAAAELDAVAPDNPVALKRVDGHMLWANSAAMKIAGITAALKDPEGGRILKDEKGNPTGILVDMACDLVTDRIPAPTEQQIDQRTLVALNEAAEKGLTMVVDAGTEPDELAAWKNLASKNELPVRIRSMIMVDKPEEVKYLQEGPKTYGPFLDVRGVKLLIDGALGSRGAALLAPYSDDPNNSGLLIWKPEEMAAVLKTAKEKGFQVGIHAIGDRANRIVLDQYEKIGVKGLRWRIEHAQVIAPEDIPRFARLDVIASMQPTHATSDGPWAADRLGAERAKGAYAWRSLLEHHTLIAGGSDAPVEDINPLWGIYAAVTRRERGGKLDWPDDSQSVSRKEALRMFTIDAAFASFRENELGSLKVGKLADMVVVPENLLTCEPAHLIDMKIEYTIVGGKVRSVHPR